MKCPFFVEVKQLGGRGANAFRAKQGDRGLSFSNGRGKSWDAGLATLVMFMAIDYVSGLVVAGVFHNSKKTASGALESKAGWKGLCRKGMSLLFVLIAYRLDLAIGSNYIRDAVIIGFIVNETISIVENAGLMGVPLPEVINKAIDILTSKSEEKGGE